MTQLVYTSTNLSIIAQIITGIVGIDGLFRKLPDIHRILTSILGLETLVQVIELLFYIFIIRSSPLQNMASIRYFDWVITTPTMLITTITYFTYEKYLEKYNNLNDKDPLKQESKEQLKNLKFFEFVKDNKSNILTIVICNFFMLLLGYFGEIGYIDTWSSVIMGFVFLAMSFYVIYDKYAKFSQIGTKMFILLSIIWSSYGIAFLFNPVYKNISYNTLDVIAKNFFGIYLYFKILEKQI